MAEKNKRLVLNGDIVYPFTKQENVIGLQKTIKEKLPIISNSEPSEGFVERQSWIEPSGQMLAEDIEAPLRFAIENNNASMLSHQLENDGISNSEEVISTQLEENNDQIISTQLEK